MKKLLLLGALLTVGATSFAATTTTVPTQPASKQSVILTQENGTGNLKGSVELDLMARGRVVAPGDDQYMLVIMPTTQNAQDPKDSIVFNFGDIGLGQRAEMIGGFKAQIIKNAPATPGPGQELSLVNLADVVAKDNDAISVKLVKKGDTTETGTNFIGDITLESIDKPTAEEVGTLSYALSTQISTDTLNGEIRGVVVASDTNYGSFNNMGAKVVVTVDADATGLPVL